MAYVVGIFISMLIFGLIIYCITGFVCHMFKKDNNPVSPFKVFCIVDVMFAIVFGLTAVGLMNLGSTFGDALLASFLIRLGEPAMAILFIFSMIFGFADGYKSKKRQQIIDEKIQMLREKHNSDKVSVVNKTNIDNQIN